MRTLLKLPAGVYEDLLDHLLPIGGEFEEAAFVFASTEETGNVVSFNFLEMAKLKPINFAARHNNYLELKETTRARLIKRAHDLKASMIELHSHIGPYPAVFSLSDRCGLKETVPHMWWRLSYRPYAAVVVTCESFDALVWVRNPHSPAPLDELVAGERILRPTNNSFEGWI